MKARKDVELKVEDIPEKFLWAYSPELMSWARDFMERGPNALIVLREIPGKPVILDGNGQVTQIGVRLCTRVDRARAGDNFMRLVMYPETEHDRGKILAHVIDIERYGPPVAPVGRPKSRPSMEVPGIQ